jgi:hypothetical protein
MKTNSTHEKRQFLVHLKTLKSNKSSTHRSLEYTVLSLNVLESNHNCEKNITDDIMLKMIQFDSLFIYVLSSTANGQLQSQHEYKQQ